MRNEPAKEIIINQKDIETFVKVMDWGKEAMFNRYGNPIYYQRYANYMNAVNKVLDDLSEVLKAVGDNMSKDTNDFLEQERRRIEGHYETKSDIIDANDNKIN